VVDDAWDGSWRRCFATLLYLATKPAHVGVDVDELSCPLHNLVPSLQWGGGTFLGDVKPHGLDIWWSIDRVDAYVTDYYIE
jgi:hypothetical protein